MDVVLHLSLNIIARQALQRQRREAMPQRLKDVHASRLPRQTKRACTIKLTVDILKVVFINYVIRGSLTNTITKFSTSTDTSTNARINTRWFARRSPISSRRSCRAARRLLQPSRRRQSGANHIGKCHHIGFLVALWLSLFLSWLSLFFFSEFDYLLHTTPCHVRGA